MGQQVAAKTFSREDRQRYRRKVRACLDVFARMLSEARFHPERRSFGLEVELNLTDDAGEPALINAAALEAIADPSFQTELGQFNVEINVEPRLLEGDRVHGARARRAREPQQRRGAVADGRRAHDDHRHPADARGRASATPRRSAPIRVTRCSTSRSSPPGARTSRSSIAGRRATLDARRHDRARSRVHERPAPPAGRSRGVRRATGTPLRRSPGSRSRSRPTRRSSVARSCGARRGSRCSSRRPTPARRSSRRRACDRACGSASAGSRRSSTCSRRTCGTSRRCCPYATTRTRWRRSSAATSRSSASCGCTTGRSTAGTVRSTTWLRDQPHLRVENRVLPAGPTVVDILANAAFYYGLLRVIADDERPVWSQMSFSAAEENFHAGARDGIEARLYWPGIGEVPAAELVLRRLLALAREGLDRAGASTPRTPTVCSGSSSAAACCSETAPSWQSEVFHKLYDDKGSRSAPRHCGR